MAKRTGNVPSLDLEKDLEKDGEGTQGDQGEASLPTASVPLPASPILVATVEVPLIDVPAGLYRPRHINIQLNAIQADAVKRLLAALDHRGDRLENGSRVQTNADVVRWLLERVGTAKIDPDR